MVFPSGKNSSYFKKEKKVSLCQIRMKSQDLCLSAFFSSFFAKHTFFENHAFLHNKVQLWAVVCPIFTNSRWIWYLTFLFLSFPVGYSKINHLLKREPFSTQRENAWKSKCLKFPPKLFLPFFWDSSKLIFLYDGLFDLNLYLCEKFMTGSSDTHRAEKATLTASRHENTPSPLLVKRLFLKNRH